MAISYLVEVIIMGGLIREQVAVAKRARVAVAVAKLGIEWELALYHRDRSITSRN